MAKKTISLITLIAFIVFSLNCTVHTAKKEPLPKVIEKSKRGQKIEILAVLKKSGEKIEFPKKKPATISGNNIVGSVGEKEEKKIELNKADIRNINRDGKGNVLKVTTKDGITYEVIKKTFQDKEDKVIFSTSVLTSSVVIPLSEVELVWLKKTDVATSFIATIGVIGLTLVGLIGIIALTKESCPFIYSFDGESYIFDAEPYGGATCEGLKRTEWCRLEYLKEVDGMYRIMITNEVDETQYTDEVKLLVVDHPQEVEVVPDELGKLNTISQPRIPIAAYDSKGRSLMTHISENDWVFWQTLLEEKSADRKEDLKEELVFEFLKPEGITTAKLLFNGCNTLWASHMVKRYLELYGEKVYENYESMKNHGPAYQMMMLWNQREELYRLQIRVETDHGWKTKGTIVGGGPFVSEDRVYSIDLSDVSGDTLKIKLTPPAGFWMINYLAMDYSENLQVKCTEIEAIDAVDHNQQDVGEILASTDSYYLVMPNIGDSAKLTFVAVPPQPETNRSYILKASGYYDIHLDAKGECQMEILTRLLSDPGFSIQYSLKEYAAWKKENREKIQLK